MKKIILVLFFIFFENISAQQLVLSENFDYPLNSELTSNGWTAHSAGTTNPVVTVTGLSFTNYYGSGIGNAAGVFNIGQDVSKGFTEQTSGATYASFLVNASAATSEDYFFHLGPNPMTTSHRGRTFIVPEGGNPSKFKFGLTFNAATNPDLSPLTYDINTTYLVVLKYEVVAGELNDKVSLFVFSLGDNINTEPSTPTIGPLTGTAADVNPAAVALRQYIADQSITVDAIRVKSNWDMNQTLSVASFDANAGIFIQNPIEDGFIKINRGQISKLNIKIYDTTGKLILTNFENNDLIDVSTLAKGIYFAQIIADDKINLKKIIIK